VFAGKIGWHIPMLMRRAEPEESDRLGAFVLMITDEVYGYLWTMPSLTEARSAVAARIRNEDWSRAWVAFDDEILVGTLLTDAEWIDDLWVSKGYRGRGIGRQLLSRGEIPAQSVSMSGWVGKSRKSFPMKLWAPCPCLK